MSRIWRLGGLFLFLFSFLLPFSCLAQAGDAPVPRLEEGAATSGDAGVYSYRLGSGDMVTIRVYGEDDLTREKIILTDAGTIFFPLVGEVKAAGITVGELEQRITQGLKGKYLAHPRVSVQVEQYRPFYINGMVTKQGSYPYEPGLTVRKAAALAGGFQERASLEKISIIRESDPHQRPQKADLNTKLLPGDIVTVGESFF